MDAMAPREMRTTGVLVATDGQQDGRASNPLPDACVATGGATAVGDGPAALWEAEGGVVRLGDGATVRLGDGATVRLREARGADGEPLRRMFLGLSDRTRYFYFCAGVPANETWAGRFAALGSADGRDSYALVAEMGDVPGGGDGVIGLARFDRGASGWSAEIGILLADAWQSRGLGRFVLDQLRVEARRRAVAVFTGTVLWENRRMMRLARRAFPHLTLACSQGTCDLTMPLG